MSNPIDDLFADSGNAGDLASLTLYLPTSELVGVWRRATASLGVDSKKHAAYTLAAKASVEARSGTAGASMSALVTLATLNQRRESLDDDIFAGIFARVSTDEENDGSGRPSTCVTIGDKAKALIRVGVISE